MNKMHRAGAVPLFVNDPYFSFWSPCDKLYEGDVTHWCRKRKRIEGTLTVDGNAYRFMGDGRSCNVIQQTGLTIGATTTTYTFANAAVGLTVRFTSPLLLTDPALTSRPVVYMDFATESLDGKAHDLSVTVDFYGELTSDQPGSPFRGETLNAYGCSLALVGKADQSPLSHSGDNVGIDWGYMIAAVPEGTGTVQYQPGFGDDSRVSAQIPMKAGSAAYLMAAYDDLAAINYFGSVKKGLWAKDFKNIYALLGTAAQEHTDLTARCMAFDKDLEAKAAAVGGEAYAFLCALSYRHSIAAHKIIENDKGELIFLSKENDSNGCIGTVDITYPSSPLYLLYNPEFVKGMLRPIFEFAACDIWAYDFAPHDAGRYPYCTGQVYGMHDRCYVGEKAVFPFYFQYPVGAEVYNHRFQMPVEESGNMLIMTAAICKQENNWEFARPYMPVLKQWSKYLVENGEDPGEQLCTDDFAGHLSHNVNLSAKAIMGVYAYALLEKALGDPAVAVEYEAKARAMAESWVKRADAGDHTSLGFGDTDSWSLKYNLVWDLFFGSKLFPESLYRQETAYYKTKCNPYGVPLDNREAYTKSDWILWCAAMAEDMETRKALIEPIYRYQQETESRVAFSDWYYTDSGKCRQFIARSVQGGIFMPLLIQKP